jgi:hypothetical protein
MVTALPDRRTPLVIGPDTTPGTGSPVLGAPSVVRLLA